MRLGVATLSPSIIPCLWNIGILLHKQATWTKRFDGECMKNTIAILESFLFHCVSVRLPPPPPPPTKLLKE